MSFPVMNQDVIIEIPSSHVPATSSLENTNQEKAVKKPNLFRRVMNHI